MSMFREITAINSRAIDDDDSDEEDSCFIDERLSLIRWSSTVHKELISSKCDKINCKLLVISCGPIAAGFSSVYVCNQQVADIVGVICCGLSEHDSNTFSQSSPTDKSCFIYRLKHKPDVLIVQCTTVISSEQAYSWVEQLFEKLDLSQLKVIILTASAAIEYRSDEVSSDLVTPFLRCLVTRDFKDKPICPYLEQPNLIAGLPAQILTFCETRHMAAALYISYTNGHVPDKAALKSFLPLLRTPCIHNIRLENPAAEKKLNDIVKAYQEYSSLYL